VGRGSSRTLGAFGAKVVWPSARVKVRGEELTFALLRAKVADFASQSDKSGLPSIRHFCFAKAVAPMARWSIGLGKMELVNLLTGKLVLGLEQQRGKLGESSNLLLFNLACCACFRVK